MRMIEIDYEAQPPIDGYGPGGFRIAGEWLDGSLIILPELLEPFEGEIGLDALAPILAASAAIDVLLIGMGPDIAPLAPPARQALDAAGIGYEIMSTPSACRTYNVLLTEDRRIGAILRAV